MDKIERIAGAEQLVATFSYWPSFHDAEVIWIQLDRRSPVGTHGPTLETLIHTFEMTSEVDADGYYVLRNHVLVHLRFEKVVELQLGEFNHQNVLMGLTIKTSPEEQKDGAFWQVEFDSTFGVGASFRCRGVEVVTVVPCTKAGEPVHAD